MVRRLKVRCELPCNAVLGKLLGSRDLFSCGLRFHRLGRRRCSLWEKCLTGISDRIDDHRVDELGSVHP